MQTYLPSTSFEYISVRRLEDALAQINQQSIATPRQNLDLNSWIYLLLSEPKKHEELPQKAAASIFTKISPEAFILVALNIVKTAIKGGTMAVRFISELRRWWSTIKSPPLLEAIAEDQHEHFETIKSMVESGKLETLPFDPPLEQEDNQEIGDELVNTHFEPESREGAIPRHVIDEGKYPSTVSVEFFQLLSYLGVSQDNISCPFEGSLQLTTIFVKEQQYMWIECSPQLVTGLIGLIGNNREKHGSTISVPLLTLLDYLWRNHHSPQTTTVHILCPFETTTIFAKEEQYMTIAFSPELMTGLSEFDVRHVHARA